MITSINEFKKYLSKQITERFDDCSIDYAGIADPKVNHHLCPTCTERFISQCKCGHVKHNLESLKNGHGMKCKNLHAWSYNTEDGKVITLAPEENPSINPIFLAKLKESKISLIKEGCWSLPFKKDQAEALKTIVDNLENNPNYVFKDLDGHGDVSDDKHGLYHILGCDGLFDIIGDMLANEPVRDNQKIAKAIKDEIKYHVDAYAENPTNYSEPFDVESMEILKDIVK